MEEKICELIEKFNKKAEEDEKFQRELEGIERTILLDITDKGKYSFVLREKRIGDFSAGDVENPDIQISLDSETFNALLNRELGPMKAIATKRLRIKASLQDMFRLRKLF